MSTVITPEAFEDLIRGMGADQLAQVGSSLLARAAERRRPITIDEAWAAFHAAPLTAAWEKSIVRESGQVRIATRLFIERGFYPEQVIPAMTAVAEEALALTPDVAREAVAAGIVDGMALWESDDG